MSLINLFWFKTARWDYFFPAWNIYEGFFSSHYKNLKGQFLKGTCPAINNIYTQHSIQSRMSRPNIAKLLLFFNIQKIDFEMFVYVLELITYLQIYSCECSLL